jgi:hypothetical protein
MHAEKNLQEAFIAVHTGSKVDAQNRRFVHVHAAACGWAREA